MKSLKNPVKKLFQWFTNNYMKAYHDKCHLLMNTLAPISSKVKNFVIKSSNNEKLLCVTIDAKFNFNSYQVNVHEKASIENSRYTENYTLC